MNPWALSISLSYLLGSIPFGYVLDGLKGAVAVLIAFWLAVRTVAPALPGIDGLFLARERAFQLACAAAVFAILGHVFPVWLGFRGGKGVATALGVFLVLSWPSALLAVAGFAVIFALTRYVSLASIVAALVIAGSLPFFVKVYTPWTLAAFVGIPALVIVKHHANIGRLKAGTESKFKSSAGSKAAA